MKKRDGMVLPVLLCLLALSIPALLAVDSVQARRFQEVETEVSRLESKQVELLEDNRKLITGISLLSSSDRIEKIATDELGMRRAESSDIIRIKMKGGSAQ